MSPTFDHENAWLTKEQAARTLSTTRETIDRWIRQHKLSTRKQPVSGRKPYTLVDPVDVERLKARQSKPALLEPMALERQRPAYAAPLREPETVAKPREPKPQTKPLELKLFLDLETASAYSGLPEALLRLFIHQQRLPAVRFGKYYVARRDLENLNLDHPEPEVRNIR